MSTNNQIHIACKQCYKTVYWLIEWNICICQHVNNMRCLKFIYRRCQEQRRKAGLEERKKKNRVLGSMLSSSFPPSECSWDAFILALHNGSSCGVLRWQFTSEGRASCQALASQWGGKDAHKGQCQGLSGNVWGTGGTGAGGKTSQNGAKVRARDPVRCSWPGWTDGQDQVWYEWRGNSLEEGEATYRRKGFRGPEPFWLCQWLQGIGKLARHCFYWEMAKSKQRDRWALIGRVFGTERRGLDVVLEARGTYSGYDGLLHHWVSAKSRCRSSGPQEMPESKCVLHYIGESSDDHRGQDRDDQKWICCGEDSKWRKEPTPTQGWTQELNSKDQPGACQKDEQHLSSLRLSCTPIGMVWTYRWVYQWEGGS